MGVIPSAPADPATAPGPAPVGGHVQVAATAIFSVAGISAYHTSIILGGREYVFDVRGFISGPPLCSHGGQQAAVRVGTSRNWVWEHRSTGLAKTFRTEVIDMGFTKHDGLSLTRSLRPFFEPGSYDPMHKNCNSFTDIALYFLTGKRLDPRFTRIERLLRASEPLSTGVLNRFLRLVTEDDARDDVGGLRPQASMDEAEHVDGLLKMYVPNPLAQGFSVESVIALWRESGEDPAMEAGPTTEVSVSAETRQVCGLSFPPCFDAMEYCGGGAPRRRGPPRRGVIVL
mmetsp:Transcript_18084/g.51472  ORF Transcript_18084/g.51472 Transcript_18084/m.51472 type:complete len:286 (+) Transcript_18084:106-963(+)